MDGRRLSIIELSEGQKPVSPLDGQVQIVFNGEIYNFRDLRAEQWKTTVNNVRSKTGSH